MLEKGRRSGITNLSLKGEVKLSYAVSNTRQLVRTNSVCSNFKKYEKSPSLIVLLKKLNLKLQTIGDPHLAGVFPIFRKIQKRKSRCATKKGSSTPEKQNISYSSNFQPRRISSFSALNNLSRVGKLNMYILRAYDMRSTSYSNTSSSSFATYGHLLYEAR